MVIVIVIVIIVIVIIVIVIIIAKCQRCNYSKTDNIEKLSFSMGFGGESFNSTQPKIYMEN